VVSLWDSPAATALASAGDTWLQHGAAPPPSTARSRLARHSLGEAARDAGLAAGPPSPSGALQPRALAADWDVLEGEPGQHELSSHSCSSSSSGGGANSAASRQARQLLQQRRGRSSRRGAALLLAVPLLLVAAGAGVGAAAALQGQGRDELVAALRCQAQLAWQGVLGAYRQLMQRGVDRREECAGEQAQQRLE
jgi:hypothetical protein